MPSINMSCTIYMLSDKCIYLLFDITIIKFIKKKLTNFFVKSMGKRQTITNTELLKVVFF